MFFFFFFSSRRRHTRCSRDWSSDVCSSDLYPDDAEAARVLESRDTVAAIVTTREELIRLRSQLRARESEVTKLREEVARLRQEVSSRQAETDKLRADLERLKQMDLRLERVR